MGGIRLDEFPAGDVQTLGVSGDREDDDGYEQSGETIHYLYPNSCNPFGVKTQTNNRGEMNLALQKAKTNAGRNIISPYNKNINVRKFTIIVTVCPIPPQMSKKKPP